MMLTWDEQIQNHIIHNKISEIENELSKIDTHDILANDLTSRFSQVLTHLKLSLKLANPALISITSLNEITERLTNAMIQLLEYVNNSDQENIKSSHTNLNSAISQISTIQKIDSESRFEAFLNRADEIQIYTNKMLSLTKDGTEAQNKLQQFKNNLSDVETKLKDKKTELDNLSSQINNFLIEFQKQFSSSQDKRLEEFNELRNNLNVILVNETEHLREIQNDFNKNLQAQSAQIISSLQENEREAKKLVGIIGEKGVTGKFQTEANKQEKSAIGLRWVSITLMMLMVASLIILMVISFYMPFSWEEFLFRFAIIITFGIPAAYTINESAKHFQLAMRNRRMELELASIDPYLKNLSEEDAQSIKRNLATNYFGNHDKEPQVIDKFSLEMLRSIPDLLKTSIQKIRS